MTTEDIALMIVPIISILIGNAALVIPLFIWNRSESRADIRHMDVKLDAYRAETKDLIQSIQQEIKDFHARLCVIEERNRK